MNEAKGYRSILIAPHGPTGGGRCRSCYRLANLDDQFIASGSRLLYPALSAEHSCYPSEAPEIDVP
jgi:hypothetical protein